MPRYLSTLNLSADAYKGLVATPHNRMDAAAPLFQSIGGTLEHYWFRVGETIDLYRIAIRLKALARRWNERMV